ncbi:MAG: hypothetical protein WAK78_15535 [Candidatus Acidiferrales bacterium]
MTRAAPLHPPAPPPQEAQANALATVAIPGPLRSFLRMAGISQKVTPEEVLPLLARNVFLLGYQGSGYTARPTEFLLLLRRYVQQSRELAALAGPGGVIHVSNCADAKDLLEILGYRTRPDCGKSNTYVETADARRAFLTIDSGFPLPDLEKTLQGGEPFSYPYPGSQLPIFLTQHEWMAAGKDAGKDLNGRTLLDALLYDRALSRLYYAWAHLDPETQDALLHSPGLKKLLPLAAPLDFYGNYITVRSGRVVVPGGPDAESAWKDLVGASPHSPGEFVPRLLEKDNGWLAAYYDSFARISADQQARFLEGSRLQRCYNALRGKNTTPSATASVFRPDPILLLLMTRVQWEPDGTPHVPGNLAAWKTILNQKAYAELARNSDVDIRGSKNANGLLEVMFALSRFDWDGGPTEAYLELSEIDSKRPADRRLSPQTVELMAGKFFEFHDQYLIFSEFPELTDASIATFITTAESVAKIPERTLCGNGMGILEANVALWQILARQGQIPAPRMDESWRETLQPFAHVSSSPQLFDAARASLGEVLRASTGESRRSQDEIINLLAGPRQTNTEAQRVHADLADRMRAALNDQRLVSLDTLLSLGEGLSAAGHGASTDNLSALAEELTEFQMPRPIFTRGERIEFTAGTYNNKHTDLEMRTDVANLLKSHAPAAELEQARGELVPFFRDTLVGLVYAYYEPPGAQVLHNNPLLVRSHDFSGDTVMGLELYLWQTPRLFGVGSPAGGGAHLVGSLADLPFVLGEMEQDFIAPVNVAALIWSDVVPCMLANSVVPRWWNVSPTELHAIALYQRAGEELLAASQQNEELRGKVTAILSTRMIPERSARLSHALKAGETVQISAMTTPADTFYLTAAFRSKYPDDTASWGTAGRELADLTRQHSAELNWDRLSADFGVPHPAMARTYARELLSEAPFPVFQEYSSRLLAEEWDSTNLYWARLADELGYPPVALNRLAPDLTVRMVARIFASDTNDWPALLRAMRETGEEFRQGKLASLPANAGGSQP